MDEQIKLLIGLQSCDLKIRDIQKKMTEGPQRVQAIEGQLKAFEKGMQEELDRLESLKRARREVDEEIASSDRKIEKSQVKLNNSKSNKEYRAALKEIDDVKREKSAHEEKALELMEEVEQLEKKCAENKAELEQARARFEEDKANVVKDMEVLGKDLEEFSKERDALSQSLGADLLSTYDFLKSRKNGVAVSSVVNAVCQTCHLGIPPQKFNELIRGDALLTCPHCSRIIYWGEREANEELAAESGKES